MPLTRPLILRHAGNRQSSYDAALLDVAQDHLLYLLQQAGLFDRPDVIFKGGTSLRKCRLGNDGRFSTDIDLAVVKDDDVVDICAEVNGARIGGFTFTLDQPSDSARIWSLQIQHAGLGSVMGIARLEFAHRRLSLPAEHLAPIRLPIHDQYGFTIGSLPVVAEAEACAEKLARYRRVALARDLYDLAWFATRPFDERLIRRLWVLKVFCDVVDDRRGNGPLLAAQVMDKRDASDFPAASIGVLTQPVDISAWEQTVRRRFAFLDAMDTDEQRWAACNPRQRQEVIAALADGGFPKAASAPTSHL